MMKLPSVCFLFLSVRSGVAFSAFLFMSLLVVSNPATAQINALQSVDSTVLKSPTQRNRSNRILRILPKGQPRAFGAVRKRVESPPRPKVISRQLGGAVDRTREREVGLVWSKLKHDSPVVVGGSWSYASQARRRFDALVVRGINYQMARMGCQERRLYGLSGDNYARLYTRFAPQLGIGGASHKVEPAFLLRLMQIAQKLCQTTVAVNRSVVKARSAVWQRNSLPDSQPASVGRKYKPVKRKILPSRTVRSVAVVTTPLRKKSANRLIQRPTIQVVQPRKISRRKAYRPIVRVCASINNCGQRRNKRNRIIINGITY